MKKPEDKREKMKNMDSMTKHGPAWHGKDPLEDTVSAALDQAKEIFRKMKGKKKGGNIMIEIEKKD